MFLINKKTGKAEKLSSFDRKSKTEDSAPAGEPVITRSSESKQNMRREQRRRKNVVEGEITRTSDRKRVDARTLGKQADSANGDTMGGDFERQSRAPRKPVGGPREPPSQSCKSYAVWLLARRDYSAAALRKKLVMRGYTEEQADEAMAFVIEHRFQDDARFAEQRSRGAENRAGNMRIEMTLRQKGIAVDLAREQVSQLGPEEERVLLASEKYRSQVAREGLTAPLKVKIYRFLAYRGFSSKAIRVAIESLQAGAGREIEDDLDEGFE
ncbi:MAG: regulatory protein RecX [Janthinobacterium lividum]